MDKLSAEQRHKNMAAIRSKDTKPEMIVRKGLWYRGFRHFIVFRELISYRLFADGIRRKLTGQVEAARINVTDGSC